MVFYCIHPVFFLNLRLCHVQSVVKHACTDVFMHGNHFNLLMYMYLINVHYHLVTYIVYNILYVRILSPYYIVIF